MILMGLLGQAVWATTGSAAQASPAMAACKRVRRKKDVVIGFVSGLLLGKKWI